MGLSVENPIVRKPIRDDIYVKAAQLKMLNTPGSAVEDRQYAITFNKVSIVTGISNEISQFMHPVNVRILVCSLFPNVFFFIKERRFTRILLRSHFRMRTQHSIGTIKRRSHH